MSEASAERPCPGVVLHQPRRGFRYGAEVFWLVGFALEGGVPATAADLGAGSGVMAWLLAAHGARVWGVDAGPWWAPLWERTARDSVVAGAVSLAVADVADGALGPAVELVVSNPPFFRAGSGPAPADAARRAARFEGRATVTDFARAALAHLTPGGRAALVVPRDREADVRAGGGYVRRSAVVGRKRVLLELVAAPTPERRIEVREDGPEVAAWYALARGVGNRTPAG